MVTAETAEKWEKVEEVLELVKASKGEKVFYFFNYCFLAVCAFLTLFPFVNVIATSFSSSRAITSGEVFLLPVEANINSYINLVKDGQLFVAMKNTVLVTVVGTLFNMTATILAAYPLSKKRLRGRNLFLMMIVFTMVFSGGMIPGFILVRQLKLIDTYWSLWLPGLLSTYNMFVMRTFFNGIPVSLEEAAIIDGANDITILLKIILPLSMPVIATLTLFYAVGGWNSYFGPLMYITTSTKQVLMVKLYQMIDTMSQTLLNSVSVGGSEGILQEEMIAPEGIRTAAIVITIAPIMCVYPFLQKYFVKGVMIGSVKG